VRDEKYLQNLTEVAKWLDTLIVEVNRINETVEDLIAEAPVSLAAWDKVGNQIWDNNVASK
jgi:hypothetical protein